MSFREAFDGRIGARQLTKCSGGLSRPPSSLRLSTAEDDMAVRRRNNGWAFVTWVPDGQGGRRQVWRSGFRTKGDATAAERRFLVELEDGANQAAAVVPAGPTVAEFLADWLVASEPIRRPTTSVSYERMASQHVIPHLGLVLLRKLAPAHIRTWHRMLLDKPRAWGGGTLSTTTVLYTHRMLRRALQDALRWELIERNPCDAFVPPRAASLEMRAWTAEEVRRSLAHVHGDRLAAMWRLFVATGMRRGEVAGLRWADVDLDAARLPVHSTRVLVYAQVQSVEPKTRRSRRVVALDSATVAALRRNAQHQAAERWPRVEPIHRALKLRQAASSVSRWDTWRHGARSGDRCRW